MQVDRLITVEFRKWPAGAHYAFSARLLGKDAHGTWLFGAAGTPWTRGPTHRGRFRSAFVLLIPNGWWAALWHAPPDPIDLYVDVNTPAQWTHGRAVLIDLDLDIVRMRNGSVLLLDEEEFEANRIALSYPDELTERARRAAGTVLESVRAREGPFGAAAEPWLLATGRW